MQIINVLNKKQKMRHHHNPIRVRGLILPYWLVFLVVVMVGEISHDHHQQRYYYNQGCHAFSSPLKIIRGNQVRYTGIYKTDLLSLSARSKSDKNENPSTVTSTTATSIKESVNKVKGSASKTKMKAKLKSNKRTTTTIQSKSTTGSSTKKKKKKSRRKSSSTENTTTSIPKIKIPPATLSSPYPVIIDHTGRPWHSNKSLQNISNLQRDRLPYTPTLRPDGTYVTWKAYLGPGQSMLRRRPSTGQVPHFEEDDERWHVYYETLVAFKAEHGHLDINKESILNFSIEKSQQDLDMDTNIHLKLGPWCNRQRYQYSLYKANQYSQYDPTTRRRTAFINEYRIQKLQELGFDFRIFNYRWQDRYQQLAQYYELHGHSNVKHPSSQLSLQENELKTNHTNTKNSKNNAMNNEIEDEGEDVEEGLYYWVKLQRLERKKYELLIQQQQSKTSLNINSTITTTMTPKRIQLLDALQLDWDPRESAWKRNFNRLKSFYLQYGHTRVPSKPSSSFLNTTIAANDMNSDNDNSDDESNDVLNADMDLQEEDVDDETENDEDEDEDDDDESCDESYPLYKLGKWVHRQRVQYKLLQENDDTNNKSPTSEVSPLTAYRIEKLNSIKFDWNPLETQWNTKFEEICEFKRIHGHSNVPIDYPPNPPLGIWTSLQRKYYHQVKHYQQQQSKNSKEMSASASPNKNFYMTPERIERLESIQFAFKYTDMQWDHQYKQLQQFYEMHGHVNVPRKYEPNPSLGNWIHWQRRQYQFRMDPNKSSSSLTDDRMERLNALGFEWTLQTRASRANTATAIAKSKETQKGSKKKSTTKNTSSKTTTTLTTKISVPIETEWDKKYTMLQQFKKKYGHVNVSKKEVDQHSEEQHFTGLYAWIQAQRKQYKSHIESQQQKQTPPLTELHQARVEKLNSIGFVWNTKSALWNTRYHELEAFQLEYGHTRVPKTYSDNPKLGQWVSVQRVQYKKFQKNDPSSNMTQERISALEKLGFEWSLM